MKIFYSLIEIPEHEMALTWIGGDLKPSTRPDRVWLCNPAGEPVLEAPRHRVRASSREEVAKLIIEDARRARKTSPPQPS
jgi:hypothetical protein